MAATTGQLGLVTPTQGTLSGTWGDTVNNGITEYVNIAIAGTLSFAGDGAITLANTTGTASATNIGSTTAQYMVIRVTGTLTTTKVITGPSYSKLYLVDNAATGGSVTFKASGQTGVTIAVGERAFLYYNGTDYVKAAGGLVDLTSGVTGVLPIANGGTNSSTASGARTNLGATTLGANLFTITNPSAVTFPQFNADNTVSALSASAFRTAIGAGTGGGSVSSVSGTGTVNGLTLTGTVTSTGSLTLGGTLSNVNLTSQVTSTLPVANGGTGVTTSTGSGSVVLSTSPTLVTPTLGTPASGNLSNCTVDGTYEVGYKIIPQNSESVDYTLVLADSGKHIYHPSTDANSRTFTIPANASVAYPIGTAISFVNMSANNLTIAINSDTMYLSTGATGSRTLAQYGSATALKLTSTTWLITGSNLT